ncbi:hypothetical protein BH11PLA2_BH11PLA2_03720 [soil metagenome]
MSVETRCPACRHPVDIPADHAEETIRCGICWADVNLGPRFVPVELTEAPAKVRTVITPRIEIKEDIEVTPPPRAYADPFANLPGRPSKGHLPLEDLLRRVVQRVPALMATSGPVKMSLSRNEAINVADLGSMLPPPEVPKAPSIPELAKPATRAEVRREDDDLRRPRRAVSTTRAMPQPDEDSDDREPDDELPPPSRSGMAGLLGIVLFIVFAAGAYLLVKSLMK